MNKKLIKVWDSLTDEQKGRAQACKDGKELSALLRKLGVALPDELLDTVASGGKQEYLEFIYKLTLWDEVCRQRGIDLNDTCSRELVWHELFPWG